MQFSRRTFPAVVTTADPAFAMTRHCVSSTVAYWIATALAPDVGCAGATAGDHVLLVSVILDNTTASAGTRFHVGGALAGVVHSMRTAWMQFLNVKPSSQTPDTLMRNPASPPWQSTVMEETDGAAVTTTEAELTRIRLSAAKTALELLILKMPPEGRAAIAEDSSPQVAMVVGAGS